MSNRPGAPLFATVNVTGVCNLRCRYCYFQPRLERHMAWEDFRRVVEELDRAQVFFINLSGGEPFAHPDIERFLHLAHDTFKHVVTLTNGTLLRARHLETIAAIARAKGGFPVQVSLDAVSSDINAQTRSASERILDNLGRLRDAGADLVVATVVNRCNAATVVDTIRELSRITTHFHVMSVQPVRALPGLADELALAEEELAPIWKQLGELRDSLGLFIDTPADDDHPERGCAYGAPCMAAYTHLVIDPDLRVRPCDRLVDIFLGDLHRERLADIWNGPNVRPILDSSVPYCRAAA